jgi:hypothetical protein
MRFGLNVNRALSAGLAGGVVLSFILLTPALGQKFKGEVDGADEAKVSFKLNKQDGEPVEVRPFKATKLPTQCGASTYTTSTGPVHYKVHGKGRFGGRKEFEELRSSYTVIVHGRLLGGGEAKGTLRVIDDYDYSGTCDTGRLDWTAKT